MITESLFRAVLSSLLAAIFPEANADTASEVPAATASETPAGEACVDIQCIKTWEINQLKILFEELVENQGGVITVTDGAHPKTVNVTVRGSASLVYSVYSPFFNAENHLAESQADGQSVGKFTIILDGLRQKLQEKNSLRFVRDYLVLQGFEVEEGGKPSPRVFPEADEFKRQDAAAFKQRFGISLNLANQLHAEASLSVSMPFAFAAETTDTALKNDLNFCFEELKLIGANGQPKECIDLKDGRFLANIGSSQAAALEKHFQQRAMLLAKADATIKQSIKHMGGPVRVIEAIRANLMWQIERLLPRAEDAASQLLVTCLNNPVRLAVVGYSGYSQEEFVRKLEKAINDNSIIGPSSFDLFLSPESLSGASLPGPLEALAKLLSSQELEGASNPVVKDSGIISHKPDYLIKYPKSDPNNNIAYQLRALDPRRSADERREIVSACERAKNCLEQMRQFRVQHSPFYLVQQIADKLKCLLQGAKEDKITEILATLGLTEDQMSAYKIVGPNLSRYNVYHIEFMLPVLVLNFCMNNAIMLRPQCSLPSDLSVGLEATWSGYLYDPQNKINGINKESAWRALEWQWNQVFKCGLGAGPAETHDYNSSFRGAFFGGSTNTGMGARTVPPKTTTNTSTTYSSS